MDETSQPPIDPARPLVGVGVFVFHPSRPEFLLGLRRRTSPGTTSKSISGPPGQGTWGLPGGHLELFESFGSCARRETLEETGLDLEAESLKQVAVTNDVMHLEGKHYVTIFMAAEATRLNADHTLGEEDIVARVMEPEKCVRWEWVSWQDLRGWAEKELQSEMNTEQSQINERHDHQRRLFSPLVNLIRDHPDLFA